MFWTIILLIVAYFVVSFFYTAYKAVSKGPRVVITIETVHQTTTVK